MELLHNQATCISLNILCFDTLFRLIISGRAEAESLCRPTCFSQQKMNQELIMALVSTKFQSVPIPSQNTTKGRCSEQVEIGDGDNGAHIRTVSVALHRTHGTWQRVLEQAYFLTFPQYANRSVKCLCVSLPNIQSDSLHWTLDNLRLKSLEWNK